MFESRWFTDISKSDPAERKYVTDVPDAPHRETFCGVGSGEWGIEIFLQRIVVDDIFSSYIRSGIRFRFRSRRVWITLSGHASRLDSSSTYPDNSWSRLSSKKVSYHFLRLGSRSLLPLLNLVLEIPISIHVKLAFSSKSWINFIHRARGVIQVVERKGFEFSKKLVESGCWPCCCYV